MTKPLNRLISLLVLGVGAALLLTTAFVNAIPSSAQVSGTATCSSGTAISDPVNNAGLISDCEALLEGKDTLDGRGKLNWSADTPIADWDGIAVDGTPERVTEIVFGRGVGLYGTLPPQLGRLTGLRRLSISDKYDLDGEENYVTGTIPPELGSLANLVHLDLHTNFLSGEIPAELGMLENLQEMLLWDNELTGEIPGELGSLSSL